MVWVCGVNLQLFLWAAIGEVAAVADLLLKLWKEILLIMAKAFLTRTKMDLVFYRVLRISTDKNGAGHKLKA